MSLFETIVLRFVLEKFIIIFMNNVAVMIKRREKNDEHPYITSVFTLFDEHDILLYFYYFLKKIWYVKHGNIAFKKNWDITML